MKLSVITAMMPASALRICCVVFLASMYLIVPACGQGNIINDPEILRPEVGQTVVLTCMVNTLQNRPVQWWFVDHNLQISNNEEILISSPHYSIEHPQGGDFPQWNLRISLVQPGDAGRYRCLIEGTNVNITSTLSIIARPPLAANFTDCCIKEGVSTSCQPLCFPSSVDLSTFNIEACIESDLPPLLKCGADGRNHAPCCRRRLLPTQCLGFCVNRPPPSLGSDHDVCLHKAADIIACFEEGQRLLPSPPRDVSVSVLSASTLYVKWLPPSKGNATGYRIHYKESNKLQFTVSDVVTDTHYQMNGLDAITRYEVYVDALNVHGSSLPSNIFVISTPSTIQPVPTPDAEEFSSCCERQGVSSRCQRLLCTGQAAPDAGQDITSCIDEMDKVFRCMAGERNHSSCCLARSIPEVCHPLCVGELSKPSIETMECYTSHMHAIVDCFNEGQGLLPGPPTNIVLHEVGATSAELKWDPPASNAVQAQEYVVLYKKMSDTTFKRVTTQDQFVKLTDLMEGTQYVVKAAAINSEGSSLPTPQLVFLTYYQNGDVVPSMPSPGTPGPTQSVDDCCISEQVKPECQPLCNITASFGDVNLLALTCDSDLGKIFMCISGGSDHTPCCQQRGVPESCYAFCAFSRETINTFTFDYAHFACVALALPISQCINEGYGTHPTWPEMIYIHNYTANTISLSWQRPTRVPTGKNLTYIVRYQETIAVPDSPTGWKEVELASTQQAYIIQGLKADTRYSVQVLASSGGDRSLPAETLRLFLLPDEREVPTLLPNVTFTTPANVTECCIGEGVTQDCLPACQGTTANVEGNCARQLDKLLRCAADDRDHRQCCSRSNVPEQCLEFCMGDGKVNFFASMLCLSFSQQIVTCFHEGYDKLPSSPQDLHVSDIQATHMTLVWSSPLKNSQNLKYDLFYQHSHHPPQKADDITSPYNLTDLKPFTLYSVYLIAENPYGISPPTPKLDLWTLIEDLPDVHVRQIPVGTIQEQTDVSLTCASDGGPDVYLYWISNNGTEIHSPLIDIPRVTRSDTGRWTCIADNSQGRKVSKDLYLHVQFAPEVRVWERRVLVAPGFGYTAHLTCDFTGFPSHIKWLKDGTEITPAYIDNNRYQRSISTFEEKGLLVAKLEIQAVELRDYGTFYCSGKNRMGEQGQAIQLINPNPDLPISPAEAVKNVTACCISKGVTASCMPACSFDIDITQLEQLENPMVCLGDLEKMIQCGADGKNHTNCCKKAGVPTLCLEFCAGRIPKDTIEEDHSSCLARIESIVDCMEEGARLIPGVPRNVKGTLTDDGYIKVWWTPPIDNPAAVQQYHIVYQAHRMEQKYINVPVGIEFYVLSGIHSNTEYDIYLEAHNHHGSSANSNHIFIKTKQFTPSAPMNLQGHILSRTHIRLDWDPPREHPGSVTHYRVYYRQFGTKDWQNEYSAYVETTYRIDKLKSHSKYEIFVKAITSTHASDRSNVIVLKTGEAVAVPLAKQTANANTSGIWVGVALTILVLLIGSGVVAFLFFRNRRKREAAYKDSVSFENPGYATASEARVTGLPNFDVKSPGGTMGSVIDGQYTEPSIMRETIDGHSDQGYSTRSHTTDNTPTNTPTAATLHVAKPTTLNHNQVDLEEVAGKL